MDAFEAPGIGDDRVAAVQDADLHRLEFMDMGGELDAHFLQRGAALGEVVLQHPLPEGLAGHGHRVVGQAEFGRHGAFARAGGRGDAVDHAIGEGHVFGDPGGQGGVGQAGKAGHGIAGDHAVSGQVVAGHDGEGGQASGAAGLERGDDGAEGGAAGIGGIGLDLGRGGVEMARGIQEIAAFGDGEADDADIGEGHGRDQIGIVALHGQEIDHGAHTPGAFARWVKLDDGGEAILRLQRLAHPRIAFADTGAEDGPVVALAEREEVVQVDGHMGAVEVAKADVHDTGREARAVIGCVAKVKHGHGPLGGEAGMRWLRRP